MIFNITYRLGEQELLKALNITLKMSIIDKKFFSLQEKELRSFINPNTTILMNGGGNFGDLWRINTIKRNNVVSWFKDNIIIFFPQTVNYEKKNMISSDSDIYASNKNLIMTFRSFESHRFALEHFNKTKSLMIPDVSFMIGNIKPLISPLYDILIIRRTDKESKYEKIIWEKSFYDLLRFSYSYLDIDWFYYKEEINLETMGYFNIKLDSHNSSIYLNKLMEQRKLLINKIISQGKVIITDRLHVSIYSVLLGKPHVIVDEKYKKIFNTRETAFYNKDECKYEYLKYEVMFQKIRIKYNYFSNNFISSYNI